MNDPAVLHGHDIVCFSSIDWQFIWQGHQEIMSTLAANGNRVLFVENTGVRAPSFRDLPRIRQRVRNWWRGTKGFRRERDNLFIYSPILLPFPYSLLFRRINRLLLVRALRRWVRAAGFSRPIVWTFLPTPLVRETIPFLDPILSVYYCIDDFASSSRAARRITRSEQRLFRDVDLVFVTSEKLRQRALTFSSRVYLFPFGVSFRKFEQVRLAVDEIPPDLKALKALKQPIVGYVGAFIGGSISSCSHAPRGRCLILPLYWSVLPRWMSASRKAFRICICSANVRMTTFPGTSRHLTSASCPIC